MPRLRRDYRAEYPVLSAQFFPKNFPRRVEGEMRLMAAVLENAIHVYQQNFDKRGMKSERLFREEEEWFQARDYRWPFSFVNVCAALNLDPEYILMQLRKWKEGEEKKKGEAAVEDFIHRGGARYPKYSGSHIGIGSGYLGKK